MSLAVSCVVRYGSSQPYFRSQSAAYVLARPISTCSAALVAGM